MGNVLSKYCNKFNEEMKDGHSDENVSSQITIHKTAETEKNTGAIKKYARPLEANNIRAQKKNKTPNGSQTAPAARKPSVEDWGKRRLELYLQRMRKTIKNKILIDFDRLLLVWSATEILRPDFIASVFGKYDSSEKCREKWRLDFLSSKQVYGGVIEEFKTEESALGAANELSMASRSLIILQLSKFLDFIVEAELQLSPFFSRSTRVFVKAHGIIRTDTGIKNAKGCLRQFGELRQVRFYNKQQKKESGGIAYEAHYAYATQAYALMLYFDGLSTTHGKISVQVEETPYVKKMLQLLKVKLIDLMDENRVLRSCR